MKEMIAEALEEAPIVGQGGTIQQNAKSWLRWQNERIEQLEKAMEEAIEESRWGDAENSLGKVNRILTAALEKE